MRKSQEAVMLNTLFESRSRRKRNTTGTAAAIAAHALIIGAAAYATATAATAPKDTPNGVVKLYPPPGIAKAVPSKPLTHSATQSPQRIAIAPTISVDISLNLPAIDIPLAATSGGAPLDFSVSPSGTSNSPSRAAAPSVYDAADVESQVVVLSGFRPQYPADLRAAGIEGRVTAQFIVGADGKTDPASIRILSSTNELFAESVRQALLKSKFRAAKIGTQTVAQLVQQLFVFKLDR
jgi:TonB family protein